MIVYNMTIKIDWSIADFWLVWMTEEHLPEIMATGAFDEYKFYRLLGQDDQDGPTYTVQCFTSSPERIQGFEQSFAPGFARKASLKWGDQFASFHSVMSAVK